MLASRGARSWLAGKMRQPEPGRMLPCSGGSTEAATAEAEEFGCERKREVLFAT